MKNHLLSGNISLLGGQSVGDLQKSMDATKLLVGDIGARMQQVQEQNNQHQRRVDDLTQRISDVEDVDMAEAISEYQLAQTVYQAALQTTSIMDRMSLMDFMR
jgi:flagellar hook-associated protein 3 FlgL